MYNSRIKKKCFFFKQFSVSKLVDIPMSLDSQNSTVQIYIYDECVRLG